MKPTVDLMKPQNRRMDTYPDLTSRCVKHQPVGSENVEPLTQHALNLCSAVLLGASLQLPLCRGTTVLFVV